VKVLKGGRSKENVINRFSIANVRPVFKDKENKLIVNFNKPINDEDDFIVRSKTEQVLLTSGLKEIDELLDNHPGTELLNNLPLDSCQNNEDTKTINQLYKDEERDENNEALINEIKSESNKLITEK